MWGTDDAPAKVGVSPRAVRFEADVSVRDVMVGTPMFGGQCHDAFFGGMLSLAKELSGRGIGMSYATIRNESLVQRARNNIVARFLASACSHLVFIDADIGFTGESVLRLIAHNRPIMAGLYRKKTIGSVEWAVNFHASTNNTAERDPLTGAIRVRHAATGFMCIQRAVLETMYEHSAHLHYVLHDGEGDPGAWRDCLFACFDCFIDPKSRTYFSEDYGFCSRAEQNGFQIWVDPGIVLEHHGTAGFIGDPMETFGP